VLIQEIIASRVYEDDVADQIAFHEGLRNSLQTVVHNGPCYDGRGQAIIASPGGIPALSQVLTLLFHSSFTEY